MEDTRLAGSFRDPAGHVFVRAGQVYRRVTPVGLPAYRQLMESGLYAALVKAGVLIAHDEIGPDPEAPQDLVIHPRQVPMISYPYEWSLSQLRDAALVTLRAQRLALRHGMSLKDASAFNVQFLDGRAVLIDTLSFESYEGGPWHAYRQFCQHFLAPLAVGAMRDPRLLRMESLFIDGLPLSMASTLLPRRSYLRPGLLMHVHMHARAEARFAQGQRATVKGQRSEVKGTRAIEPLIDSLERTVKSIAWSTRSEWADYYADAESYSRDAFTRKVEIVRRWLEQRRPARVWDLGANTGHFSRLAAELGADVVALDSDAACVDTLYREAGSGTLKGVLPLVVDLANPSAGIGWGNTERMTLDQRGPADMLVVLAVTHHLAIGNNVPLPAIADYLARLGRQAIVEFVPKDDPMVQGMLRSRADIFTGYTQDAFERAMTGHFTIDERVRVEPSDRHLYLLTRR